MINVNKYLFLSSYIIIIAIYLFSFYLLFTFKENLTFDKIKKIQQKEKFSLYLSGVFQNTHDYKFYNFIERNPKLLALGSSRAMSIRGEFFKNSYYNGGGLINNFEDLNNFLSFISNYKNKNLEELLIVIDPWWFLKNKNYNSLTTGKEYSMDKYNKILNRNLGFTDNIKLLNSIIKKGMNISKFFNKETDQNNIGLESIYSNSGFDYYGSFHYDGILSGKIIGDIKFAEALNRNKINEDPFTINNEIDLNKLLLFVKQIEKLSQNNLQSYIIFLPIENTLKKELKAKNKLKYLYEIFDYFDNNKLKYFNYSFSNFDSCEYIDPTHVGDVITARILLDINFKNKIKLLKKNLLLNIINKNKGYASWHANSRDRDEIDFLKIGCSKN